MFKLIFKGNCIYWSLVFLGDLETVCVSSSSFCLPQLHALIQQKNQKKLPKTWKQDNENFSPNLSTSQQASAAFQTAHTHLWWVQREKSGSHPRKTWAFSSRSSGRACFPAGSLHPPVSQPGSLSPWMTESSLWKWSHVEPKCGTNMLTVDLRERGDT